MKLYSTASSPFGRKVKVVAHETGLAQRIEIAILDPRPTPVEPHLALSKANPLSKIPTLILDDGRALFDSRVICEYLDAIHDGPRLLPTDMAPASKRWNVLRVQALSDGILDASILVFYDRNLRPKELAWEPWRTGQIAKATQGLDALEGEAKAFDPERPDLGQVAAGCLIGWLEFRNALGDVRSTRPALNKWYEAFRQRPSMRATEPHA